MVVCYDEDIHHAVNYWKCGKLFEAWIPKVQNGHIKSTIRKLLSEEVSVIFTEEAADYYVRGKCSIHKGETAHGIHCFSKTIVL